MSFGLKVWDENGVVTLDQLDRMGRYYATVTVPAIGGNSGVTVSVPGLTTSGFSYFLTYHPTVYIEIRMQEGGFYVYNRYPYTPSPSFPIHVIVG